MTERTHRHVADEESRVAVPARPRAVGRYERAVKPVVDRVVGLLLLLVLVPLLALVALGVFLALGRPILYRQTRVGHLGEHFTMLKFRSMGPDRRQVRAHWYDGPERRARHKTDEDPRHTAFGRFLRHFSLDELPQLWNVVRGDLSLVGPRPELPQVVAGYEDWQHARHDVRPGVTGLWQVTERDHDGMMHRHVGTDLRYIHRLSARLDLWIALWTLPAVLGAQRTRTPRCLDEPSIGDADRSVARRPARVADEASAA